MPQPPRLPDHRVALVAALVLAAVVSSAPRAHADVQMYQPLPFVQRSVVLRVDACTDEGGTDCAHVGTSKRTWSSLAACRERAKELLSSKDAIARLLKEAPRNFDWVVIACNPAHTEAEA